ncbi:MAG: hypothetical protein NZ750_11120 [Anaerolineae bacterium]|nr:hypothetical protein [Anaerolineae bacterium]MDW8171614.1 hypothetical protein [Anaerolineae bacterium]
MHWPILLVGISALVLTIMPSLAQDDTASAKPSGFIAISGTAASVTTSNLLTLEGVPNALPVVFGDFAPDLYVTADFVAAWNGAVQVAAGATKAAGVEDVALEATVVNARLIGSQVEAGQLVDYVIGLKLESVASDGMGLDALVFLASDVRALEARNAQGEAAATPKLPSRLRMENFVLYIDLTPAFLEALVNGAIQAEAEAIGQGRPSGAKSCRPAAARRC